MLTYVKRAGFVVLEEPLFQFAAVFCCGRKREGSRLGGGGGGISRLGQSQGPGGCELVEHCDS